MTEKYDQHMKFMKGYNKCKEIDRESILAYVWDNYEKQIKQLAKDGDYEK